MELALDIGNSRIKAALVKDEVTLPVQVFSRRDMMPEFADFCRQHQQLPCIVSSVSGEDAALDKLISGFPHLYRFNHKSKLPFSLHYHKPESLGLDRLAAVAGAIYLKPHTNILVIDAGTCITYDLLRADAAYLGGAISPGLQMRYRSLHEMTGRLPLVKHREFKELNGQSTEECILSGVQNGVIAEIHGIADQYMLRYSDLQLMLCGGDAEYLAKRLKYGIFAVPELVLAGLHHILKINAA